MFKAVVVLTVAGDALAVTVRAAAFALGTPIPANEVAINEMTIKKSMDTFFIKHLLVTTLSVMVADHPATSKREAASP